MSSEEEAAVSAKKRQKSAFIENEAEESSADDEDDASGGSSDAAAATTSKKHRHRHHRHHHQHRQHNTAANADAAAAEAGSDDSGSDDDDDDDDDEEDEEDDEDGAEENDGFLVPDDAVSDDGDDNEAGGRSKHRRHRRHRHRHQRGVKRSGGGGGGEGGGDAEGTAGAGSDAEAGAGAGAGAGSEGSDGSDVDEEDYALIRENTNIDLRGKKGRHKRLKRRGGETHSGDEEGGDGDGAGAGAGGARDATEAGEAQARRGGVDGGAGGARGYGGDDDDDDDGFIVDEYGRKARYGDYGMQASLGDQVGKLAEFFGDVAEFMRETRGSRPAPMGGAAAAALAGSDEDADERVDVDAETEAGAGARRRRGGAARAGVPALPATTQERVALLRKHVEPAVLEEQYLDLDDRAIRVSDRPERFSVAHFVAHPESNFAIEARWIYSRAFARVYAEQVTGEIATVLRLMHTELVEVPFIEHNRPDYWGPLLKPLDLWTVAEYDARFWQFCRERDQVRRLCDLAHSAGGAGGDGAHALMLPVSDTMHEAARESLDTALGDAELSDTLALLQLEHTRRATFAGQSAADTLRVLKSLVVPHARRVQQWRSDGGVYAFLEALKFNPLSYHANASAGRALQLDAIAILSETPEQLAARCLDSGGSALLSPHALLKNAARCVAYELAHLPSVRRALRDEYIENAQMSTTPTASGRAEIDAFHLFAPVKQLDRKPVILLQQSNKPTDAEQFAMVQKAAREGFITVAFSISEQLLTTHFVERLVGYLMPVDVRENVDTAPQWAAFFGRALRKAARKFLAQAMQRDLHARLLSLAQERVSQAAASELSQIVGMAPFLPEPGVRTTEQALRRARSAARPSDDKTGIVRRTGAGARSTAHLSDDEQQRIHIDDRRGGGSRAGGKSSRRDRFVLSDSSDDGSGSSAGGSGSDSGSGSGSDDEHDELRAARIRRGGAGGEGDGKKNLRMARRAARATAVGELRDFTVLAIAGLSPTVVVVVNGAQEVLAVHTLHNMAQSLLTQGASASAEGVPAGVLGDNDKNSVAPVTGKRADLLAIKELLETHRPYAIVIGADSLDARRLQQDITQQGWAETLLGRPILVTFGDPRVPAVLCNSEFYRSELGKYTPAVRSVISFGFMFVDPLAEVAKLFVRKDDLRGLRLHLLQDEVEPAMLRRYLERVMITWTNCIGFDVNRALATGVGMHALQFVCGLGPRKATSFLRALRRRDMAFVSRRQLVEEHLFGKTVMLNCASFLVVNRAYIPQADLVDVLDTTHIHPENYALVQKIAADALDVVEESDMLHAVENVMKQPHMLLQLDLDAFAQTLERDSASRKYQLMRQIVHELSTPGADRRMPYQLPRMQMLFLWMTGESMVSLRVGMIVEARVVRATRGGALCRLDNDLVGWLPHDKISSSGDVTPTDVLVPEQVVRARITRLRTESIDEFGVELTTRSTDLRDESGEFVRAQIEEIYVSNSCHFNKDCFRMDLDEQRRKAQNVRRLYKRAISHALFKNVSQAEAEALLKDKPVGDVIFRPSSRGYEFLVIVWKVADGVYGNIEIKETQKENSIGIGKQLMVDDKKFDDLDEVLAVYVQPLLDNVRQIEVHRRFNANAIESIVTTLKEEKRADPRSIPYALTVSRSRPGMFELLFWPYTKIERLLFTPTPSGVRMGGREFATIERMLGYFKANWKTILESGRSGTGTPASRSTTRAPAPAPPRTGGTSVWQQHVGARGPAVAPRAALPSGAMAAASARPPSPQPAPLFDVPYDIPAAAPDFVFDRERMARLPPGPPSYYDRPSAQAAAPPPPPPPPAQAAPSSSYIHPERMALNSDNMEWSRPPMNDEWSRGAPPGYGAPAPPPPPGYGAPPPGYGAPPPGYGPPGYGAPPPPHPQYGMHRPPPPPQYGHQQPPPPPQAWYPTR